MLLQGKGGMVSEAEGWTDRDMRIRSLDMEGKMEKEVQITPCRPPVVWPWIVMGFLAVPFFKVWDFLFPPKG